MFLQAECPGGTGADGNCPAACGAPPWAVAAVVLPYNVWRYHGDIQILEKYYPRMKLFMMWLQSTADNSTGLVTKGGLADWCPPANVDDDPKQVQSFSQVSSRRRDCHSADIRSPFSRCFNRDREGLLPYCADAVSKCNQTVQQHQRLQVMGYQMLAESADALGKHDEAATIRATLAKLSAAYTTTYYNSSTGSYQDNLRVPAHYHGGAPSDENVQTSNSMALWLGIPTASERAKVVDALVANVESRGHHLSTGIIGTRVKDPQTQHERSTHHRI